MPKKYRLTFSPKAKADLKTNRSWYNSKKANLGDEFKDEVIKVFRSIERYPFLYKDHFMGIRKAIVLRFPYCLYYIVDDINAQIVVLAIMHNKRGEEVLHERLK